MEWQIFALLQMAIITVGVAVVFTLHNRKLAKQNNILRAHLAQQSEVAQAPSPDEWVQSAIAAISEEDPNKALIECVLNNALQPADDFAEKLTAMMSKAPVEDQQALQDKIARLTSELETAQAQSGGGAGDAAQSEELKNLLQQFTKDSREMMACIRELEKENSELQAKLDEQEAGQAGETSANATTGEEASDGEQAETEPAPAEHAALGSTDQGLEDMVADLEDSETVEAEPPKLGNEVTAESEPDADAIAATSGR